MWSWQSLGSCSATKNKQYYQKKTGSIKVRKQSLHWALEDEDMHKEKRRKRLNWTADWRKCHILGCLLHLVVLNSILHKIPIIKASLKALLASWNILRGLWKKQTVMKIRLCFIVVSRILHVMKLTFCGRRTVFDLWHLWCGDIYMIFLLCLSSKEQCGCFHTVTVFI